MDEVEVDPQLFVKCRLCLKDTGGMFQIVPKVRDQIKFCFDIEVEQFDGLPQLICKTCRTTLTEYANTKLIFTENQKSLKTEINVKQEQCLRQHKEDNPHNIKCHSPQQTTVTSSQEIDSIIYTTNTEINTEIEEDLISDIIVEKIDAVEEANSKEDHSNARGSDDDIEIPKRRKRRLRLRLSSESSEEKNQRKSTSPLLKQKNKSGKKISWKTNFNKKFVCVLCPKQCKTRGNLTRHLEKHEKLISQHKKIFAKCCTVQMNRVDNKPNLTDSLNKVVFDFTKITGHGHRGNIPYSVLYFPKENIINNQFPNADILESSEEEGFGKKASKRARLLSRSSNETVVLEKDSKIPTVTDAENSKNKAIAPKIDTTECINIDDSSNSDMEITSSEINYTVKPSQKDYNTIQGIVMNNKTKYYSKIESSENDLLLKHKILNMGRKVINKQGFNCTGLLRFMEHKNLDIIWTPTELTPTNANKETNYVRIMPKIKSKEKMKNDRWNKISETEEKGENDENTILVQEVNTTVDVGLPVITSTESISHLVNKKLHDQAVLYAHSNEVEMKNKLLNANPVANPKQLPKKANALENKPQDIEQPEESTELCMPIITSTTSLAVPSEAESKQVVNNTDNNEPSNVVNEVEKSVPRIKVKPVSELMSERVLKNLSQQQIDFPSNIWSVNNDATGNSAQQATSNSTVAIGIAVNVSSDSSGPNLNENLRPPPRIPECVILHTTELPNHKTESPFRYLKQLLYIHNIVLLDPNEVISENFICLIKFKLQYKQDNVAHPVVLLITFSCLGNTFHLGVKHSTAQEVIDLNTLPANWQWEILKQIYQEEVVNKVLKNAQKINTPTYEYTKKLFCLMKSIQCKKI